MRKLIKILFCGISSFLLCSCFPQEEINYEKSSGQMNSVEYSETDWENIRDIKDNLRIEDEMIKGDPDSSVSINIKDKSYDGETGVLKFLYHSFTEQEIENLFDSDLFYENRIINYKNCYDDEVYEGYKVISVKTDSDRILSGRGLIKYTTNKADDEELQFLVGYDSPNIRSDIDKAFSQNIPENINISDYTEKTGMILSKLDISYDSEPSVYYLNKNDLAYQYRVLSDEEKEYSNDYILLCYNNFIYNNTEMYNSPVQWRYSGSFSGSSFYIIINAENGKIEFLKGDGLIDEKSLCLLSSCDKCIPLIDAVSIAAYEYMKVINTSEILISDASLKYVPAFDDNKTIMIPCWIINAESSTDIWNEKLKEIQNFSKNDKVFINAVNGMVME